MKLKLNKIASGLPSNKQNRGLRFKTNPCLLVLDIDTIVGPPTGKIFDSTFDLTFN